MKKILLGAAVLTSLTLSACQSTSTAIAEKPATGKTVYKLVHDHIQSGSWDKTQVDLASDCKNHYWFRRNEGGAITTVAELKADYTEAGWTIEGSKTYAAIAKLISTGNLDTLDEKALVYCFFKYPD